VKEKSTREIKTNEHQMHSMQNNESPLAPEENERT
jgi:hypothetical protein